MGELEFTEDVILRKRLKLNNWEKHRDYIKHLKEKLRYSITINNIWKDYREGEFTEWELYSILNLILNDEREPFIRLNRKIREKLNVSQSVIEFTDNYKFLINKLKEDGSIENFQYYLDPLNLAKSIKTMLDYISEGRTDLSTKSKIEEWEKIGRG